MKPKKLTLKQLHALTCGSLSIDEARFVNDKVGYADRLTIHRCSPNLQKKLDALMKAHCELTRHLHDTYPNLGM